MRGPSPKASAAPRRLKHRHAVVVDREALTGRDGYAQSILQRRDRAVPGSAERARKETRVVEVDVHGSGLIEWCMHGASGSVARVPAGRVREMEHVGLTVLRPVKR